VNVLLLFAFILTMDDPSPSPFFTINSFIIPNRVKPAGRAIIINGVVISGCPTLINVVGRPIS
jgi:hypothetical protein